jgi:uncharacterized protein YdeI (YjbR/CyaY-like superfamily)
MSEPIFFESAAEWRAWLEEHHETATEVWVGMWRKASGRGMTWSEAVDEALCFGWIDSVAKRVDDERRKQRFTPRKPRSNWSLVNVRKVEALRKQGRMRPAGEAAFARRRTDQTGVYSFEQRGEAAFTAEQLAQFQAHAEAWAYWEARPPGYKRMATWWVVSAKREETRQRRLATLIEDCAAGRPIKLLTRPG